VKGQVKVAVVMERGRRRSLTSIISDANGLACKLQAGPLLGQPELVNQPQLRANRIPLKKSARGGPLKTSQNT